MTKEKIIALIEKNDFGDAFDNLEQLDLLEGDLLQLEDEYTKAASNHVANYKDRLKTAVRRAFRNRITTTEDIIKSMPDASDISQQQIKNLQNIIPKPESYFAGRKQELLDLENIFKNNSLIAIVGAGGMGKTQLVTKYLEQHPILQEKLCWVQCEPTTSLDSIMEKLGYSELLKTKDQKDLIKIENFIYRLEREQRYLFLEDYHDINETELIEKCLSRSQKSLKESKIILISRDKFRNIKLKPRQFDLEGFKSKEDLLALIDKLSTFFNFGDTIVFSQVDLLSLAKRLEGHPLAIYLAFHLLESGASIKSIEQEILNLGDQEMVDGKKETISERLLNAIFTRNDASEEEQQFVKEFSVFRGMIHKDTISAILKDNYRNVATKLTQKNILKVNRKDEDLYYYLHPLVREFCYDRLKVNAEGIARSIVLHLQVAQHFIKKRSTIISIIEEERIHYHLIRANAWEQISKDIEHLGEAMIAQGHLDHLENLMKHLKGSYVQVPKIALAFRGRILYQKGHVDQAAKFFIQAENETHFKTRIKGILGYGELLYRQGKIEEAYQRFELVLELLIDKADTFLPERIFALLSIGVYHDDRGNYDKSLELYKQAEKLAKKNGLFSELATALGNLGLIYSEKRNFNKALNLHKQSLELRKKLGEQSGIAYSSRSIGNIHKSKGELNKALKLYQQSLDICKKLGMQSDIATSLHSIASIHANKNNNQKALKLYQQSLDIKKKLGNQSSIAVSLHNIGTTKDQQNKKREAIFYFLQALLIKKSLKELYKKTLSWLLDIKREIGFNQYKKLIEETVLQYNTDLQAIFTHELKQEVLGTPIRKKVTPKRNDKVKVKYADGSIKIVKYKKVETTYKNGTVEILEIITKF